MPPIRFLARLTSASLVVVVLGLGLGAARALAVGDVHLEHRALENFDARPAVEPTAAQVGAVAALGARAGWNARGTPSSLISDDGGYLAAGLGENEVAAAREFVRRNAAVFGLSARGAEALDLVSDSALAAGSGHAVMLRSSAAGLPTTLGGMVTVGVVDGKVAYASSSGPLDAPELTGDVDSIDPVDAWRAAAADAGVEAGSLADETERSEWTELRIGGLVDAQRVRPVAIPLSSGQAVAGYEALVVDSGAGVGYRSFIDASSGEVVVRRSISAQLADNPRWDLFRAYPRLDHSSADTRSLGCFVDVQSCEILFGPSSGRTSAEQPWDWNYALGQSTNSTTGNNADSALSAFSPLTPGPDRGVRPTSPTREYRSPFTNAWFESNCNPSTLAGGIVPATGPDAFGGTDTNDINAATTNLFVAHNRMHDWSYHLGFSERNFNLQVDNLGKDGAAGDPELGNVQAGALTGGSPTYTGRDNANQISPPDGVPGVTNMYLWQPVAAAFYPPCVDGDFDMSVIGHEYTHAISNRMIGGPDDNLSSGSDGQALAMGESFSDLVAVEILQEFGYTPVGGENPYVVGAYVTGDQKTGIRNYAMNRSPLNYSDVQGYDGSGNGSPHDDGEIWSAVNFDVREALVKRYDSRFAYSDASLQRRCAEGAVNARSCPGNRRWIQLVFDSFLLMPGEVSMLDARDALLAADRMRFDGRNQKLIWRAFARRGFGADARSRGTDDAQPEPDFSSPRQSGEARVRFVPIGRGGKRVGGQLFVGRYTGRVTPIADSAGKTDLDRRASFVPGAYRFVARVPGYGMKSFKTRLRGSQRRTLKVRMEPNWASKKRGARASGDGTNQAALINENDATNWTGSAGPAGDVRGTQITVDLAGRKPRKVKRLQVSALLRPRVELPSGDPDPQDPSQNRFTGLRSFRIELCNARRARGCAGDRGFRPAFKSARDAFPAALPRPTSPDLAMRGFTLKRARRATHVRLVTLATQCTGGPAYQGELDADPSNITDCATGAPDEAPEVRVNELQVFSRR